MHINDLPNEVLELVFRAAMPAIKHQLADVKGGLGLLSVCRRWRQLALPLVYDTVVINCGTGYVNIEAESERELVDIETTLVLVEEAKCLHVVRRVVIDVFLDENPLPGLMAVVDRMNEAADEWTGVLKLEISVHAGNGEYEDFGPSVDGKEDQIVTISNGFATLLPRLREIKFGGYTQAQIICEVFGQLVGYYANQLQVLHSSHPLEVRQDHVFTLLRDVSIEGSRSNVLDYDLPLLDPEVIESLVLLALTSNNMWSLFYDDEEDCTISFPRLHRLYLEYLPKCMQVPEDVSGELLWNLRFPALKSLRIVCLDEECASMENAVFPARLETLDIQSEMRLLRSFSRANVQVCQSLSLHATYQSDEDSANLATVNRVFVAGGPRRRTKLTVDSRIRIPLELFTYTEFTHLHLNGPARMNDILEHIRMQPCLVRLDMGYVDPSDAQIDLSIPDCTEHEPVAPLDTQLYHFRILLGNGIEPPELALPIVKYLLLKVPTLRKVSAHAVSPQLLRNFANDYAQWYPHLEHVKFRD